ncbi:MAG: metallophosphoesterase [Lentisphaeria bacterium]|nr:metallophosphoesterase [Lentisphaeria bacterium]
MNGERSIWVVGDIHGMLDPLTVLLNMIRCVEYSTDREVTVVFLGDYIDHGPCSREVVDALLAFRAEFDTVFLAGNHEDMLLQFLDPSPGMEEYARSWLVGNGGEATVCSFVRCRHILDRLWMRPEGAVRVDREEIRLDAVHLGFFRSLEYACSEELTVDDGRRLSLSFTHAPLHRVEDIAPPPEHEEPEIPLERQLGACSRAEFLALCREFPTWIERYHIWNRSMPRTKYPNTILLHGHSPTATLAGLHRHRLGNYRPESSLPFVTFAEGKGVPGHREGEDIYFDAALREVVAFNIDTGCVYGDALTALNFSSRRIRTDARIGVLQVHSSWAQRDYGACNHVHFRFREV